MRHIDSPAYEAELRERIEQDEADGISDFERCRRETLRREATPEFLAGETRRKQEFAATQERIALERTALARRQAALDEANRWCRRQ